VGQIGACAPKRIIQNSTITVLPSTRKTGIVQDAVRHEGFNGKDFRTPSSAAISLAVSTLVSSVLPDFSSPASLIEGLEEQLPETCRVHETRLVCLGHFTAQPYAQVSNWLIRCNRTSAVSREIHQQITQDPYLGAGCLLPFCYLPNLDRKLFTIQEVILDTRHLQGD